jgi:competence protein ComEA
VIAVLVAVGLAVSCWWLLRSEPEAVGPTAPARVTEGLVTPADRPDDPAASPTALVVDVAGRVRRPGIAVLDPGARVVDALEAAGGARPGVDLSSLNLARALVDGEQILVGVPAPPGLIGAGKASVDPPPGGLVNLNTADLTQLEALPEVGPVTAQAIIGWREEHGGFSAVDELLDVDGIGEATLSQLAPLVTV